MKKFEKIVALVLLIFACGFNLWLYRFEPTAKIDPNDNPFQYALVDRTNQMWDYAKQQCGINVLCFTGYLIDHWVPNWAEGYNLPYYYSHAPQIVIVSSYRFIGHFTGMTLFQWYHILIYLLLCLFPISVYLALKIIKTPPLIAGVGAILASQVSTDGLFGLDPSSFLWRGYGLTSQLFAMVWMPAAIAFAFRFLNEPLPDIWYLFPDHISVLLHKLVGLVLKKPYSANTHKEYKKTRWIFWLAVLFVVLTISGHLGLGIMTLLSIGVMALAPAIMDVLLQESVLVFFLHIKDQILKLILLAGSSVFFLSYWILPALLNDKYHNFSFWDPVWKFNSWGWKEVVQYFLNGALFDFGRFPFLTICILIGCFAVIQRLKQQDTRNKSQAPSTPSRISITSTTSELQNYYPFSILFVFWMMMFFGRTTWGNLLDIIPSMKEFHQSRFIVGVHLAGFFLAPLGIWYAAEMLPKIVLTAKLVMNNGFSALRQKHTITISPTVSVITICIITVISIFAVYPQTMRYSNFNDVLIERGNGNFDKQHTDVDTLIATLKAQPSGRVFTGRGGSWGKKLQIAETTYFMHLSTFGIPVILWLPETWSPNSDVEQFMIEERAEHYDLLNIKYVVTPPDQEPQKFWKLMKQTPSWKLYTVDTAGYFGYGSQAAVVYSSKFDYINVVRLWLQSDYPTKGVFPELTFDKHYMMTTPLPAFEMTDEASYKTRDGKDFGLFGDTPVYEAPAAEITTGKETTDADMDFKTTINVKDPCKQCMVFLKQSFHPNWRAWVDGKKTDTFISFPFFTAIHVTPGTHTVEFKYEPGTLKMFLFTLALLTGIIIILPFKKLKR